MEAKGCHLRTIKKIHNGLNDSRYHCIHMNQNHVKQLVVRCAVITVSSTRTTENDMSGVAIRKILSDAGMSTEYYAIVPDRIEAIRDQVYSAMKVTNCIILNGGTGLTFDDCTIEAVSPLLDKKIDGFGEMFRAKSIAQIGTSAMLSRAVAGIRHGKAIFCVPGSTPAVTLALNELIVPEIVHILSHANK